MKKCTYILFFLLISASLSSQINMVSKKIFLDSLNRETTSPDFSYTRIITNYSQKSARYVVTDFYKNGRKKMTGATLDRDILKRDGEFICYYKNGAKESVIDYVNDQKSGKEINWYENQSKKSEKKNSWNPQTKKSQTLILNYWTKDKEQTVTDGNGEYEETDGFVTQKGEIKNGLKQGAWLGNDLVKNISFVDNYEKGILTSGVSIDKNNVKTSYSSLSEKQLGKKVVKLK
ncbi:hypothetical protein [Flavobacterium panacagri]|uniref:hypothetical protein n=1 Tax=Flavobacterium panacagri TaxID=3034146 RepID=UPI0025A626AE|nr:hypothetical protein [Flavobacterium panacagri]